MENQNRHHGSLIAFEGPEALVSTQLRLLPASPQLLILPTLQHYMKENTSTRFSSRAYIKDVHEAALARRDAAMRFLDESSSNSKRLVFLNGGTAGAVSQCISAISECQASGDAVLAETIYKNIASEGVRGLDQEDKYANHDALERLSSVRDFDELLWEGDFEDPIIKAMRAADALYKETDSLQPIDCYIRTRPRSLSLPSLDYSFAMGQASPFFVFGSSPSEEAGSVLGEDEETAAFGEERSSGGLALRRSKLGPQLSLSVPPRPASHIFENSRPLNVANRQTVQLLSPTVDSSMSPPMTPEGVVYGEARMVQMAASKSLAKLRKTRSLDDMGLIEARRRRISVELNPPKKRALPVDSPEAKSRHLSIADDPYSPDNLVHLPQAKLVKAQTTTIRRSPTFLKNLPKPARDTYVHHGTDVADFAYDNADWASDFEPVLTLHEDIVIQFTSFGRDYVLDSVVQSFKDGSYPVPCNTLDSSHTDTAETDSCPSTPRTADLFELDSHPEGLSPVAEVPSADEASDYDPFAARGIDVRRSNNLHAYNAPDPPPRDPQQPPTPAQTPTPYVGAKFYDLSTTGRSNAIATQNALRGVLKGYFPQQESTGYFQFGSSWLPDADMLWRPIFSACETPSGKSGDATADLILAIGCQNGVKSEFVSALTGQIEKLGSKSNGQSRSGRLDIRYLIATAMQSFSTQPLTSLTADTLTDSPHSLACLLIPHLETYLTINTATRFLLLSYPVEHLAIVLALQKLIGVDTFKVAGVLNTSDTAAADLADTSPGSNASSSLSITTIERLLGEPSPFPAPPSSTMPTARTLAHRRRISFSRADYVLASSATEAEIAALISTLWKVLVEIDAFYTPNPHPRKSTAHPPPSARLPAPPPLVSKFTPNPLSPPLSPPYNSSREDVATTPRSLAALNFPYAPPPLPLSERDESPSRWSGRSGRQGGGHISGASRPMSLKRGVSGGGEDDARSAYAVSVVEEGEFYDAEERRLMPMYMRQSEIRKGNSRKALKWLGLA